MSQKAIVRVHGKSATEIIHKATIAFLKKANTKETQNGLRTDLVGSNGNHLCDCVRSTDGEGEE